MKVLVCGSRKWLDALRITDRLKELPPETVVITGGAMGADRWAKWAAEELGLHVAEVRPLYGRYDGKLAPIMRNTAMLHLEPDLVIAFTVGSALTAGTEDTVGKARDAAIPIEIHYGDAPTVYINNEDEVEALCEDAT